jgi:hypothetical protein
MSANRPLTIVILIDALGWEIVRKYEFCRELLPASGPLDTVLGYSSAAIPSLLSGKTPAGHGAWAMYRYAPASSPFRWLRILPRLPHALEWRMRAFTRWLTDKRRAIRGYYDLYDIPLTVLPYFDVAQRGDPYEPRGMGTENLFDGLVSQDVEYRLWTYRTPEVDSFAELRASLGGSERLLFLYTAELDALMHRVGVFHDEVRERLHFYEEEIRGILGEAREAGRDTHLYLFSDHGMTDVKKIVDVGRDVEGWGLDRKVVAFYDSTMARFWCPERIRDELVQRLNETGYGHVVTPVELAAYGCDFGDNAYGDVIFLMDPGKLIVPSYMGREAIRAMHGYDPSDPFSRGVFMSSRHDAMLPRSILDLKDYLLNDVSGRAQ